MRCLYPGLRLPFASLLLLSGSLRSYDGGYKIEPGVHMVLHSVMSMQPSRCGRFRRVSLNNYMQCRPNPRLPQHGRMHKHMKVWVILIISKNKLMYVRKYMRAEVCVNVYVCTYVCMYVCICMSTLNSITAS